MGVGYQRVLIALGIIATLMLSVFFYRELFPEYRIYQDDYVALEKFRSSFTGEPAPEFKAGVKQIVFEREDKGPASVDRCISCHVATQLPHFSPTKIATDSQGVITRDAEGIPVQIPNEEYVWTRLDKKIDQLLDSAVIAQLKKEGDFGKIRERESEAERLKGLKIAHVGEQEFDVTRVLRMHPLIGKETRPFEFHPLDDYGCTVCHSGNGRALTTDKAHGPVFDGQYEQEFTGFHPEFTEKDPENDPRFSQVFNHKPGDSLLFQTAPILPGKLIQARCIDCHKQTATVLQDISNAMVMFADKRTLARADQSVLNNLEQAQSAFTDSVNKKQPNAAFVSDIDLLTKDYKRGQQLYLSQACYACHRIAGLTRGGVGPELTRAGTSYPWYLKESIVWPQADLKTSTMPNYALDHVELEDLMTFLLAQRGASKSVSDTEYKTAIQRWEQGGKLPWEKAITPTEVRDLKYSMTVFATEGCAACHRLEGFESNVGFAIEKQKDPGFDALYKEKSWFKELFPEEIRGSDIVKAIDAHAAEIDSRIVDGVRKDSLLEEIEAFYPDTVEALYSNFRFASRAKNHLLSKPSDHEDLKKWKERVHRLLMLYVQEYGLGRLIGPRPNWSGVYRSDEWLIEHFRNPGAHTPRSLMPVFPFDDTKFYALTHMLDVLGKKNRDAVRTIWEHRGFNPEQAYGIYCSQCHGPYLQGNGPVATWIYPIPKNLRNTEFLRSLTKEKAINSIMHGVNGTPMPPWSETPRDKENYDGIPVINAAEVKLLVDWIYMALPFSTSQGINQVPKWNYSPQDVLHELEKENTLKDLENHHSKEIFPFDYGNHLYASLDPVSQNTSGDSNPIFEQILNPTLSDEKYFYYIRNKYYTPKNLAEGKRVFELNCAACHGNDADGSGSRAMIMSDAKPRMLVNLDWIDSHDDLRLLRSIKYGVPGTAMTPWGDLTNGMQRLQLVMYIRSLSFEKQRRQQLLESVYKVFEENLRSLEKQRAQEYGKINALQTQHETTAREQSEVEQRLKASAATPADAVTLYQKQLEIEEQLTKEKANDQLLIDQQTAVRKRMATCMAIGNDFISANVSEKVWNLFLKVVEGSTDPKNDAQVKENAAAIVAEFDAQIAGAENDKLSIAGKIQSPEKEEELNTLKIKIEGYRKLKTRFTGDFLALQ